MLLLTEELVLMDKLEYRCICVGYIDVNIWFLYLDVFEFVL